MTVSSFSLYSTTLRAITDTARKKVVNAAEDGADEGWRRGEEKQRKRHECRQNSERVEDGNAPTCFDNAHMIQ